MKPTLRNLCPCLFVFSLTTAGAQQYGLTSANAVGKYLNNVFPQTTPVTGGPQPPATLSATNAFTNLATLTPAAFFIPFDLNAALWSDNAAKSRWIALPNDGTHNTTSEQITVSKNNIFQVPRGTVTMKHFELPVNDTNPAIRRRLETRFFIKGENDVFYGVTYKWRADGTNADLVGSASVSETITITTAGGTRTQDWYYPSRADCMNCHNPNSGGVLGPRIHQLNKDFAYPSTGVTDNQLRALNHIGVFATPLVEAEIPNLLKSVNPFDATQSLEVRARSYLSANCSDCHSPGGPSSAFFDARFETPLAQQNLINGPLLYNQGIAGARLIKPQSVPQSLVHWRMNRVGPEMMPPIARNVVDTAGVALVAQWINSLSTTGSGENTAPVALADNAFAAFQAATVIDPLGNDTDADGDPLTIVNPGTAAHGSIVMNGNGTLTYTPAIGWTGSDSFLYQAADGRGGVSNSASVTVVTSAAASSTTIAFTDRTSRVPGSCSSGAPVAVADMNNDRRDDIVRLNTGVTLQLRFQQPAGANFTSYQFGTVSPSGENPWGMCIADVNEDGINDIAAAGYYDGCHLFTGNAAATAWTRTTLPGSNGQFFAQAMGFMDLDNNGAIDLFICHDDGESWKFRNTGTGSFVADAALINAAAPDPLGLGQGEPSSGNYGITWTDYDNDGDFDLYIAKCRLGTSDTRDPRRVDKLLRNDGDTDGNGKINYNEAAPAAGIASGDQTWSADFGDIDNDGDMDMYMGQHSGFSSLFRNNGNATYTDIGVAAGVRISTANPPGGMRVIQTVLRDFNNDGWLDLLLVGNSHRLYRNNGNSTFTQVNTVFNASIIESCACGDLDHDGFVDVYASYATVYNNPSGTADKLWMNNANGNNWFAVDLRGRQSNRNGIGTRVKITTPSGQQIREVRGGEGYGITHSFTSHFGLGTGSQINQLTVRWPSGVIDTINNPAANQFLLLQEGSSQSPSLTRPSDQQNTVGQSVTLNLVASDPTNDPLTFAALNLPPGLGINATTGAITGTLTAGSIGRFSVNVSATDGFTTVNQSFIWDVNPVLSGFALWQSSTPGAGITAHSDIDLDGFDDVLEYALGGNPATGNNPPMTLKQDTSAGPDNLVVTFRRPLGGRSDVNYLLQCSNNLGAWTDITAVPAVTSNGDGTESVRYEHLELLPAVQGNRCQFRLTISITP